VLNLHAASDGARVSPTKFGWRRGVLVYVMFAAGVVAVTWPLALSPATLWPPHYDARVFTWVMASMARRLIRHPLALFQGNAFYPFGNSLAYTELLLPPSLLGFPGFVWGNPILTYNLLLLGLWPLNGLAIVWVAHRLTRSLAGACVAGAVFCLSPYFTEYYLEFQMLLAALLPLVMFAWVRWLETGRPRWLALGIAGTVVQALTTWYYGIILGLGLVTLSIGFLALRWGLPACRRLSIGVGAGATCLGLLLLPFALPYLAIRQESGYERSLGGTATHYADLATFVAPGTRGLYTRFYLRLVPSGHIAETSAFPGFAIFGLAAASLIWLRRDGPMPAMQTRLRRVALVALLAALMGVAWAIAFPSARYHLGRVVVHLRPREPLYAALAFGLALLAIRGWSTRLEGRFASLTEGDWVRLLLLLTAVFAVLALGPVIHVAQRPVGPGPYGDLYPVLFPLHVIRVTVRFAVLTLAGLALLAALGLRAIEERLKARVWPRRVVLTAILLALLFEYGVAPASYESERWIPRPVDAVLRADPDDVAVLEFPTNTAGADADAMFRSLWHGKRVVNGISGYVPDLVPEVSALLTTAGSPFPVPEAQAALRRIYPLRYLVVRLTDPNLPRQWVVEWESTRWKAPPLLRFRRTLGGDDLYEIVPLPERSNHSERWVSHDFLRQHRVLDLELRPLVSDASVDQWVEVSLNGDPIDRLPLNAEATRDIALPWPSLRVAPNVIELVHRYRRPASARDERYKIGMTGVLSPGDLRVSSAGQPYGSMSSILFNGAELSRSLRGYNVVALDPAGHVIGVARFDTFATGVDSDRLEAWLSALSPGTIVAGAVHDEASVHLTRGAVAALATLGVVGDLRGRYRESHAFVGVRGARPGTALEAIGPARVRLDVGDTRSDLGYELTAFTLNRAADIHW
jgi:hypothetical protein